MSKYIHSAPEGELPAGLYLIATPIGNLRDITLRALDTLTAVNKIYCEDTRVTGKLLSAYGIKKPMKPYHDHSDENIKTEIIDEVKAGRAIALCSDAGMPLISDPGYKLVHDMVKQNLPVFTIPGANAALCALQLSALPSDQFMFAGFVPQKEKARHDFFENIKPLLPTVIAYETAPRLLKTLGCIEQIMPDRQIAVVREITKMFEETRRGTAIELKARYEENGTPKGEIVLVIEGTQNTKIDDDIIKQMLESAMQTMRLKEAVRNVAENTGHNKNAVYDMALEIKKS